uniref:Fibronectin type-III domain-containing protein n=1 Tax=Ciona intestinalis TaxID=7719 RepID=F7AY89_CIOIN
MENFYFCLLIFLWFAATSATNSSNFYPTSSANIQDCPRSCAIRLIRTANGREEIDSYHTCMNECTGSWPLMQGGNCSIQDSVVDSNFNPVCTPISVNISKVEVHLRRRWFTGGHFLDSSNNPALNTSSEVSLDVAAMEYAVVSWLPCPSGLRGVTGFQVLIQRIEGTQEDTECHNVTLRRTLQEGDAQIRLSVLSRFRLKQSSEYRVAIRSLPTPNSGYVSKTFNSKSCLELYGLDCRCGRTLDSLPPPTVTVEGYSVTMSITVAPTCFAIGRYEIQLAFWKNGNLDCDVPGIFLSKTRWRYGATRVTFGPVYNPISGRSYTGYYQSSNQKATVYSQYTNFTVTG